MLYIDTPGMFLYYKMHTHAVWSLTNSKTQDDHNAEENWDKTVSTNKALQYTKGWDAFLVELVKVTPNNRCTDWKLPWRNP